MHGTHWEEFFTASVPSSQRMQRWVEFGADTLCEMVVRPTDPAQFRARIQRVTIDSIGLAFVQTTPATAAGLTSRIGRWAAPEGDALVLTLDDRGRSTLSLDGMDVELEQGDMVIRDLSRPWESIATEDTELILVKIPMTTALRSVADPDQIIGRKLTAKETPVALAASLIRSCRTALREDPDGEWHAHIAPLMSDIVKLASSGLDRRHLENGATQYNSLRRRAIRAIMENLSDPALTVAQIASRLSVSQRQLQRAFLAHGTPPRQYILEQRLKLAASLIADSRTASETRLTDIAFSIGFNDMSHFSRAFTRHFGCSPSAYRKRLG